MSLADKIFVQNMKDILESGTSTEGQKVRPHWEDGTPAYTIKKFGGVNRYDLRKEFPAMTLRKTGIKSAMDEILWIFQKKSNNIADLNSHIWDSWADDTGSIGSAYGAQIRQQYLHHTMENTQESFDELVNYPSSKISINDNNKLDVFLDQMDAVLWDLKHAPFGRRIMTSMWNFSELHSMNLQPCCWNCTFNVTDEGGDKLVLNMVLNQRSADMLTANNWNVCQYAILLMMIAQVCDMEAGELVHVLVDYHIYDRHVDLVKELITREQYPAPIVKLNPDIKDFYKFKVDDLIIENYKHGEQIKIPVAI